jgi:hypothetical protein
VVCECLRYGEQRPSFVAPPPQIGAVVLSWRLPLCLVPLIMQISHKGRFGRLSWVGAFICGAWAQRKVPFIKKGALVKWSICGAEALSVVWRLCELGRQYSIFFFAPRLSWRLHYVAPRLFWCLLVPLWSVHIAANQVGASSGFFLVKQGMSVPLWGRSAI